MNNREASVTLKLKYLNSQQTSVCHIQQVHHGVLEIVDRKKNYITRFFCENINNAPSNPLIHLTIRELQT